jgi:hypothetical protein
MAKMNVRFASNDISFQRRAIQTFGDGNLGSVGQYPGQTPLETV